MPEWLLMRHCKTILVARRRLSPINSTKHVVDVSGQLASAATSISTFAATVDQPSTPFNPSEVNLGAHVYGFFITLFVIGSTGAPLNGPIDWYIAKARTGQNITTDFPEPGATGVSALRNQIIHEEKGLAGSGDGTAMAFKGVVKVPKAYQRCRSGDTWFIKLKSADGTNNAEFCIKIIHKSFR